jgi:murein DD-endopeptidase MepM/ murein hydrolase activator NlpD
VPYHPDDRFDTPFDEGEYDGEDDDFYSEAEHSYSPGGEHLEGGSPGMLVRADVERQNDPVLSGTAAAEAPLLIPGTGTSMGNPFIKRRPRPLSMRLAIVTILACLLITGLISAAPLSSSQAGGAIFEILSGAADLNQQASYHWYAAQSGDDLESVATKFNVQVGGIMELNNLPSGQELQIGKAYKIPDDPFYGLDYRPANPYGSIGGGSTVVGSDWWNSYVGPGLPEQSCAPNGGSNPLGYDLQSPNWGSQWVRGFSWYHNGVDIAAPNGNPIRAAQAGLVTWAGWTNTGFGYSIVISHCHNLATLYGHMQALLVKADQTVTVGQEIGLEGATGWATGPHLHLSVISFGQLVDPMAYFPSIAALTTKA